MYDDFNNKPNWFIGHMKKTVSILETKKKEIDFVIELIDARLPITSSNKDLIKIFNNKPIIKIAVKNDLTSNSKFINDILYCSIFDKKSKKNIIKKINLVMQNKRESLIRKGMKNPKFVGIVIGLPNIGKSSIINFLASKKIVEVQNKPGVTRKIDYLKIDNSIYLLDSPGVFVKSVESYFDGLKLALINCINRDVVNKKDLATFLFETLKENNKIDIIKKYYSLENIENLNDLIIKLSQKRNINLEIDNNANNLYLTFIKDIFDSGLSKIYLE